MAALFRASEGTLATKMLTLASAVLLLQEMKILPTEMYCDSCTVFQDPLHAHHLPPHDLRLNCLHGLPQSQIPGYSHPIFSLRIICVTNKLEIDK